MLNSLGDDGTHNIYVEASDSWEKGSCIINCKFQAV